MVGLTSGPLKFYGPLTAQVLQLLSQLQTNQWLPVTVKAATQSNALASLLVHAYRFSPFWRQRLGEAGFNVQHPQAFCLKDLPVLTRDEIQLHFASLRSRWPECDPQKFFTVATSGSTGQPVRVEKYGDFYHPLDQALALLELDWFKRDPGKSVAYIGPQVEDKVLPSWGGIYQALGHNGRYYKRNFSDKTVRSHLDWLASTQPAYLKCSSFLAAQMAALAINLDLPIHVDQIISVSETVSPKQRQLCQMGLGAKIVDRYSSEETGMIALQCPKHDHLHVIDSSVVVEIVDEAGNPCPPGQVGRVLVTALHSFAMPIIRYDLGDLAEWGVCDCGRTMPVIKRVWGRTRASVVVPGQGALPMGFIGDDLGKIEMIREFRLRQYQGLHLELELVTSRRLNASEITQLRDLFLSYGLGKTQIFLAQKPHINWPANKKRQEFEQVPQPFVREDNHQQLMF